MLRITCGETMIYSVFKAQMQHSSRIIQDWCRIRIPDYLKTLERAVLTYGQGYGNDMYTDHALWDLERGIDVLKQELDSMKRTVETYRGKKP